MKPTTPQAQTVQTQAKAFTRALSRYAKDTDTPDLTNPFVRLQQERARAFNHGCEFKGTIRVAQ